LACASLIDINVPNINEPGACSSNDDCINLFGLQFFCNFDNGSSGICNACSDVSDSCESEDFQTSAGLDACNEICDFGEAEQACCSADDSICDVDDVPTPAGPLSGNSCAQAWALISGFITECPDQLVSFCPVTCNTCPESTSECLGMTASDPCMNDSAFSECEQAVAECGNEQQVLILESCPLQFQCQDSTETPIDTDTTESAESEPVVVQSFKYSESLNSYDSNFSDACTAKIQETHPNLACFDNYSGSTIVSVLGPEEELESWHEQMQSDGGLSIDGFPDLTFQEVVDTRGETLAAVGSEHGSFSHIGASGDSADCCSDGACNTGPACDATWVLAQLTGATSCPSLLADQCPFTCGLCPTTATSTTSSASDGSTSTTSGAAVETNVSDSGSDNTMMMVVIIGCVAVVLSALVYWAMCCRNKNGVQEKGQDLEMQVELGETPVQEKGEDGGDDLPSEDVYVGSPAVTSFVRNNSEGKTRTKQTPEFGDVSP